MVVSVLLGTAIGLNLAFGPEVAAQETGPAAQWASDEELVDRGAQLFGTNCAICHGEGGRGNVQDGPQAGPSLIGVGAASVDYMIRSGKMPMDYANAALEPGEPEFTGDDRRALVAYVYSLAPGLGPAIPDIEGYQDAELTEGLAIFTRNCAACHGPTGAGIAVGQDDVSSALDEASPIEIAEAVRSGPGVMPRFLDDSLEQEELEAVTAWVLELREPANPGGLSFGRSGPVTEGIIAGVVGLGLLGVVMYLLGERSEDSEAVEDEEVVGGHP